MGRDAREARYARDMTVRSTRRSLLLGGSGLALGAAFGALVPGEARARSEWSSDDAAAEPVSLVVLAGVPGATTSYLHHVACDAKRGTFALGKPVRSLTHEALATVFGTMQGAEPIVVVEEKGSADVGYRSVLMRIREKDAPLRLATSVAYASRPHSVPGTTLIAVSRGASRSGSGAKSGASLDDLTLDAIDLTMGGSRTLYRGQGSALYIVGAERDQIVFLHIGPPGGTNRFYGVDPGSGAVRFSGGAPSPVARDFTLDRVGRGVLWTDVHDTDRSRWVVRRLDFARNATETLHEDSSGTLAPQIWPDGSMAITRDPKKPLERFDIGRGKQAKPPSGLPVGIARIEAVSPHGIHVAVSSTANGGLPRVSVVETASGKARTVVAPKAVRLTVLGFVRRANP